MTDEEKTATLIVGSWSSKCSACGGNAMDESHHTHGGPHSMWDADSALSQTNGCGARFVAVDNPYAGLWP